MQAIQYVALIFGLLGFIGYCQLSTLKQRISALEEQLSKIQGTTYFETRQALRGQIESLIGKPDTIEMKEDLEDADIISYGNTSTARTPSSRRMTTGSRCVLTPRRAAGRS